MQNKGAIKLFAILLALVCLYQLSFTLITRNVESSARDYAKGDGLKETQYLDSMQSVGVYNLLVKDFTYKECKEREINLGLDLKGGMNVTLEISEPEIVKALSNYSTDPTFTKALNQAIEAQKNSQQEFVVLFGEAFKKADPNARLAAIFSTSELQSTISYNSTNEDVLKVIKEKVDGAVNTSYRIIKTRIDKFGVTQPNVQLLQNGRIMVELPGVKEKERVRKLLQGTAKLEFWPCYSFNDLMTPLVNTNKILKTLADRDSLLAKGGDTSLVAGSPTDTAAVAKADSSKASTDKVLQELSNSSSTDTSGAKKDSTQQSAEQFMKENPLFAVFTPADYGVKTQEDYDAVHKSPVIGFANSKDTAKVMAIFNKPEVRSTLPADLLLFWSAKPAFEGTKAHQLIACRVTSRDGRAPLDGSSIIDARGDQSQNQNTFEVSMQMNQEGAAIWRRMTSENIKKSIAIVLDGQVYSYPTVQGEIPNGNSSITGNFTVNESKDLANILKAGALPTPCRIVEEAVVGPTLGAESINSGLISFIVAFLLILGYMIFYYSNAGLVADIAMFANLFFVFGVLASLGAVLTLPGIAGIVLIIGMSVDANVLIYERIREELRLGKGIRLAISDGYRHAYSAIIDSNITTLLVAIILYIFGTGPIQGFATTLIIGILTSLFSAIFLSRLVFEWMLAKNKPIHFSTKLTEDVFKHINIDWISKRKIYYAISGTLIVAGAISYFTQGFTLGVDFKGGRTYRVNLNKDDKRNSEQLAEALKVNFDNVFPVVKTLENSTTVKITTSYLIDSKDPESDNIVEAALIKGLNINKDQIESSQKVGPTVADDIASSAVLAILFSILVIFLYILARFHKWTFGLGASIAMLHDALLLLACFSLLKNVMPFSLEIDQAFIAAILTVMAYSVTDTVVVFDRIREYLANHKKGEYKTVINMALNSTLSRTINTSMTIFLVLLAIFIFGGDTIRGFSFALLIGIVVGTYSSLCIATPIVVDFAGKDEVLKA